MKPGVRIVSGRMVKIVSATGKHYIPVLANRWLKMGFQRKQDAQDYRDRVRRRFERMTYGT